MTDTPRVLTPEQVAGIREDVDRLECLRTDCLALCDTIDALRAEAREREQREREALTAHSASFGALQAISSIILEGEVDDYGDVVRAVGDLRAQLRERAADSERLDVLIACLYYGDVSIELSKYPGRELKMKPTRENIDKYLRPDAARSPAVATAPALTDSTDTANASTDLEEL